jgi:putative PIN family toxin of toxin-antitoxin system
LRVVFDTNIYISGIFWKGTPRELLRRAIAGDIELLVSKYILEELKTVLWRDFEMGPEDIKEILENIVQVSEVVDVKSSLGVVVDKADNKVLACALDGRAEYLVSGDRHLLDLGTYKKVKVVKASEMMEIIE